ncbi:MAG: hypothetical protein R2712_01970 [Vicinamibacterales bacterium]
MPTGRVTRGEVEVDEGHERGHRVTCVWLEPCARIHPVVKEAIGGFDAAVIGPGSFFTSLMPTPSGRRRGRGPRVGQGAHHPRVEPADRVGRGMGGFYPRAGCGGVGGA